MFLKKLYFIFSFLTYQLVAINPAEWSVLLIMQGDNNLSFFMHQNISVLKKIGSTKQINILAQWDEPVKHTTWRYKIGRNALLDNASLAQDMGVDPEKELIDAAKWAFTKYPAKKKALIFWNHGSGILDEKRDWKKYHSKTRGILYDFSSGKCLTNAGLLSSLRTIQRDVLHGEMLDLIGMDACLMAMVEIAYQIKDFTKTFVASENIEHAPGWHYNAIFEQLTQAKKPYTPQALAHLIVHSFERFHKPHNNIYTQSFIDLSTIGELKNNIASVAAACLDITTQKNIRSSVKKARKTATEFDDGHFVDLYDFYRLLSKQLDENKIIALKVKANIQSKLHEGMDLIKKIVVESTKGSAYPNSHGLSIYFPRNTKLHRSYKNTLLAQETLWPVFIDRFKIS